MSIEKYLRFRSVGGRSEDATRWLVSLFVAKAFNNKKTIYSATSYGFCNIKLKKFIKKLMPGAFKIYQHKSYEFYTYKQNTILSVVYYSEAIELSIDSVDPTLIKLFNKLSSKFIHNHKAHIISVLVNNGMGFSIDALGAINEPLIKENYNKSVVEDFKFVYKDLSSPSPLGRLCVVNGPPGTGKTYLIKGLINKLKNCTIVLIPAKIIGELDGPSILPLFTAHKKSNKGPMILIVEDADACIATRMVDNVTTISSLLNYTDGILGSFLDLRVIASTNQKNIEIDPALTRAGRLSKHIEVGKLSAAQANKIYSRLVNKEVNKYSKEIILADIYRDAISGGANIKADNVDLVSRNITYPDGKSGIGFY